MSKVILTFTFNLTIGAIAPMETMKEPPRGVSGFD